jgi:hypothetical protein
MVDPQDADLARLEVDLVLDPVRASAGGPQALDVSAELMSGPSGVLDERTEHELDHGRSGLLGEAGEAAFRRRRDDELRSGRGHALCR